MADSLPVSSCGVDISAGLNFTVAVTSKGYSLAMGGRSFDIC